MFESRPLAAGDIARQVRLEEEASWIPHDGGPCPIPWAKAGEYEVVFYQHGFKHPYRPEAISADIFINNSISHYRLTDGWIPIINGKCLQVIGWQAGTWEWRNASGEVTTGITTIYPTNYWITGDAVAIRRIPTIRCGMDSGKVGGDRTIVVQQYCDTNPCIGYRVDLFTDLMASYEAKRRAIRNARSRKSVVPPIGMAAMMRIAGEAMEDK